MGYSAKILADSVSPDGVRLTSFEVTFPRIVLAEFNTHRVFSRNSASSRAIPVEKMIERVMTDPYIPSSWGKNQKGMQAGEDLDAVSAEFAEGHWLSARNSAVAYAQKLLNEGVHKQLTNRLLEPFLYHTVIVTATEWSNFFHLRCNPMAHPDIQIPARMMQDLYEKNEPEKLQYGEWHLPLIGPDDYAAAFEHDRQGGDSQALMQTMCKVSVGRCARVSYLTHDGKRDLDADIALHDSLLVAGHMSPFEHVARPATWEDRAEDEDGSFRDPAEHDNFFGNFRGWIQYRKTIPGEADILGAR